MDRYVLVILLEAIKHDLHLSDTALGVLAGFAFVAIYSVIGIPIARFADRGSRRTVISLGVAFWSLMTAASAFTTNFSQLIVARCGVAIGESACSPPASALIADYFPARWRATAFAIYGVGIYIGMALGLFVGGWINELYGWRAAFLLVGMPGLLLALLVRLTVREPRRGQAESNHIDAYVYSVKETIRVVLSRRSFLPYAIGLGPFSFSSPAFEIWTPVYLMRGYHMGTSAVGTLTGLVEGFGGIIGAVTGGIIADRLGARDIRWYLWTPAVGTGLMVLSMLVFLHTNQTVMIVFYFVTVVCSSSYLAPAIAITHRIMPLHMRALATALLYLLLNLLGPGAGPLAVGVLNDLFVQHHGGEAIRVSLSVTVLGAGVGVVLMLYAARFLPGDSIANDAARSTPTI